jgi:hypothetical protein
MAVWNPSIIRFNWSSQPGLRDAGSPPFWIGAPPASQKAITAVFGGGCHPNGVGAPDKPLHFSLTGLDLIASLGLGRKPPRSERSNAKRFTGSTAPISR